jgi:hypothetical protein
MKIEAIDTALYLDEFKERFYKPIKDRHEKYMQFKSLPESEEVKAKDTREKEAFLSNFIACVEATIEQNVVLKNKLPN